MKTETINTQIIDDIDSMITKLVYSDEYITKDLVYEVEYLYDANCRYKNTSSENEECEAAFDCLKWIKAIEHKLGTIKGITTLHYTKEVA